jgi:hypothetical protein
MQSEADCVQKKAAKCLRGVFHPFEKRQSGGSIARSMSFHLRIDLLESKYEGFRGGV